MKTLNQGGSSQVIDWREFSCNKEQSQLRWGRSMRQQFEAWVLYSKNSISLFTLICDYILSDKLVHFCSSNIEQKYDQIWRLHSEGRAKTDINLPVGGCSIKICCLFSSANLTPPVLEVQRELYWEARLGVHRSEHLRDVQCGWYFARSSFQGNRRALQLKLELLPSPINNSQEGYW